MDNSTYSDPMVVNYLNSHFVTVRVYPSSVKVKMLALKFGVQALPTTVFLEYNGLKLTGIRGYIGPRPMWVLLQYVGTRSYRRIKFLDYVKKNFPELIRKGTP